MIALALNYLGLGLLYLLSILPIGVVHAFGDFIGTVAFYLPIERKKVVDINLQLCFPNLSGQERRRLALQNWRLFGRSIAERGYLWLGSKEDIQQFVTIDSAVDLQDHTPRLYVGMHMLGIEAGLIGLSLKLQELQVKEPITLYVKMKNTFFDEYIKQWRERFGAKMILRQKTSRELIRAIRSGQFILVSPDMDLGIQDSVFVPFFNILTCTVTSISRMAELGNAQVCPVVTTLNPNGKGYTCKIFPPLDDFPTSDHLQDTARLNHFFEEQILPRPEEYYWVHKRFKNRPDGEARFY